ncbi:hypothetical protein [Yersinia hibernica]|uniref:hypothetical protein n=1 Tax=Yersinia hibernica TaxID=2339259 RepID=UPI00100F3BC2|nr:hypothetical protein [Yersinia hibernica]
MSPSKSVNVTPGESGASVNSFGFSLPSTWSLSTNGVAPGFSIDTEPAAVGVLPFICPVGLLSTTDQAGVDAPMVTAAISAIRVSG